MTVIGYPKANDAFTVEGYLQESDGKSLQVTVADYLQDVLTATCRNSMDTTCRVPRWLPAGHYGRLPAGIWEVPRRPLSRATCGVLTKDTYRVATQYTHRGLLKVTHRKDWEGP